MKRMTGTMWVLGAAILMWTAAGFAGEKPADMGGWDTAGAYNAHYKNSERDRVKGVVEAIEEVTPLEGMSPGIALIVKDKDSEKVTVHVGPKWFVKAEDLGVRVGDEVKIKGVWAEIRGADVFMAAKVKRGEYDEYKIRRTSDGFPFWAMTPEEAAKESASD